MRPESSAVGDQFQRTGDDLRHQRQSVCLSRVARMNPLNYPVGTVTIFNGLGNFSENSAFNRSTGGHADTRLEGYVGDTFNVLPNLNVSFGVNYVCDTGRTDSDLAPVPCSAINTTIVTSPAVQRQRSDPRSIRLSADAVRRMASSAVAGQQHSPVRTQFCSASRRGVGPRTQWPHRGARQRRLVLSTISCCRTPIRIASTACRMANTTAA